MSRSRMIGRGHGRALALGVGLSLVAHALVIAFVRLDVAPLESRQLDIVWEEPEAAPLELDAMELVELRLLEAVPPSVSESAIPSLPAGAAAAPAVAASVASAPMLPTVSAEEPTYDALIVLDPVQSVAAGIVPFDELDVAETTPLAEKAEAPVYVPGSIGKAKRGWASQGEGEGKAGEGAGWATVGLIGGRGDGHCPMPGKGGRMPPPVWTEGTILR